MIKTLNRLITGGNRLDLSKGVREDPKLTWRSVVKDLTLSPRRGDKVRCLLSSPLCDVVPEVLARAIRQEKEIKAMRVGQEEVKRSRFS